MILRLEWLAGIGFTFLFLIVGILARVIFTTRNHMIHDLRSDIRAIGKKLDAHLQWHLTEKD